ncbi:NADH dehydrogenase subunit 3 [Handroanthus impetiginosus]|uniref:NADH-ubiquinone oxidoreductase chain 3 n=1 Tax=Handroanthus impetiginosus TaxID=429701 RepID=A0A2G9HWH6_9LAMI|nr:NADH dehydrogenase subunit 3 [Handroanthus impetiginosus]
MFEISPLLIYLVINLLVSLIAFGVPFQCSSNSSTYLEKLLALKCEVTFSFPWAIPPKKIDPFGSWSMMAFLLILMIGSLYEWKSGASYQE